MDRADINQPAVRLLPAERDHIFCSAYVNRRHGGGDFPADIHDSGGVKHKKFLLIRPLCLLRAGKQRPKGVGVPNVPPNEDDTAAPFPGKFRRLFLREQESPYLPAAFFQLPQEGASQMTGRAGNNIYFFHRTTPLFLLQSFPCSVIPLFTRSQSVC